MLPEPAPGGQLSLHVRHTHLPAPAADFMITVPVMWRKRFGNRLAFLPYLIPNQRVMSCNDVETGTYRYLLTCALQPTQPGTGYHILAQHTSTTCLFQCVSSPALILPDCSLPTCTSNYLGIHLSYYNSVYASHRAVFHALLTFLASV